VGRLFDRLTYRSNDMTYSTIFDDIDKPRRKKRVKRKAKQSVLWTVYHTVLAVELLIIIIIEGIELLR
jgi:hypothetical protein